MSYQRVNKPDTEVVNKGLQARLVKIIEEYQNLEKKMQVEYRKVEEQAFCEHDFHHWVDESYDGHRTDRWDVWTCKKCKWSTG